MLWLTVWIILGAGLSLGPLLYVVWLRRSQRAAKQRYGRKLLGRARHIEGVAISEIQDASVVRVRGRVKQLERELSSPLTGKPCVYWRIQVSVQRWTEPTGRYRTRHAYWQDTVDHSEGVPFVLSDGRAECAVDPTLATAAIGAPKRLDIRPGQVMPSAMAVLLTEQQISLDEIRREVWRFEEQVVAVGQEVVVVGAGHHAKRTGAPGEASYRESQASWPVLDGNDLDLLITDDKKLMKQGPAAVPSDRPLRERWQGRDAISPDMSLAPLDEYEASLKGKRRFALVAVFGAIGLAVSALVVVPAILRALKSKDPEVITAEQLASVQKVTQEHRVRAYRSDDAWREAFGARDTIRASSEPCAALSRVPEGATVPIGTIGGDGALPLQSPRTSAQLAALERVEAELPKTSPEHYQEAYARAEASRAPPLDLLFDTTTDPAVLYLYDHEAKKIVCKSEPPVTVPRANEVPPGMLGSLRAVANVP